MPDSNQWSIRSATMDAGRLETLRDNVVKALESTDEDMPTVPATDVHALLCHMEHRAEVIKRGKEQISGLQKDLQRATEALYSSQPGTEIPDPSVMDEEA